jgi:hypothetical protein
MAELDREGFPGRAAHGGERVIENAKSAVREVSSAARDVARERAQGLFESNKAAACAGIHSFANALRTASDDLEPGSGIAQAARRAADKLEDFSAGLEQRDVGAMIDAAQDYARRQPAVFFGGALVAGFALARFLKASSARRQAGTGYQPAPFHGGESYEAVTTGGYVPPHTP